jgi:hypothetical protein
MQRRLSIAFVVTLLPAALLWLWKLTYVFSDWAAIWLLCVAAMIFLGNRSITIDRWKAERGIVLRSGSWLAGWLTGRIGAFLSSTLLVLLLVPALAWNALTMSGAEIVVSLALVFASAWLFLWMQSFLARHFMPPFDRIFANGPSAWMVGLPFSVTLFFVTWYAQSIPAEMLTVDFATDVAMIKLDEYITRDDFERDLRELIDDHKKETQRAMEQMLASKILAAETKRKVVVREISLSELKDADRLMACEAAASILGRYDGIRGNLQARSSANIASFQADLRAQETSHLLAPWIDTMKAAITDQDLRPWIFGPVILNVDFPEELHEGRKIWGELRLAGTDLEFVKTESDTAGKYSLRASVGEKIVLQGKRRLELELVQDLGWTSWNRDFEGSAWFDVSENFSEGSGIAPKAAISLTMTSENEDEPVPRVEVVLIPGGAILPGGELPDFCTQ